MRGDKQIRVSLILILLALLIFSGCRATTPIDSTALPPKEPVADPDITVEVYIPSKACNGTTILADNHRRERPRIIEVDMEGKIIWEYAIPLSLRQYTNPGFDVEPLPNNNVLFALPGNGIYEIDRQGKVLWSHLDPKVSHDVDRLPNGNTLYVYGNNDRKTDAQVKEVDPSGRLVWSWYAMEEFDKPPYRNIYEQGWTHTNAVTRMKNGNTLISPRNFGCLIDVDPQGRVIRIIGKDYLEHQHDPEVLTNGNILLANHANPHEILEIDPETEEIVWRFAILQRRTWPVRDANRLPNGNILITGTTHLFEITPEKELVWLLSLKNVSFENPREAPALGFYKAERIPK
jgi:hypothetical protein